MQLKVECYAGHRGEQLPQRLVFDARQVAVAEVLDAWLGPDHRYFKVRGEDDVIYILRHDTAADVWELTMLDRGESRGRG